VSNCTIVPARRNSVGVRALKLPRYNTMSYRHHWCSHPLGSGAERLWWMYRCRRACRSFRCHRQSPACSPVTCLSKQEFHLFKETWDTWTREHAEYANPQTRVHLVTICLENVLMFRLQLLGVALSPRLSKLYHASYRRQQRARLALGATRHQRLCGSNGDAPMNVAVLAGVVRDRRVSA
jgi:hypothetical protein